jgi:hypothetical protein
LGQGEVRHLLESVVLQVNSDLAPGSEQAHRSDKLDPQRAADEAMTAPFDAFAGRADG